MPCGKPLIGATGRAGATVGLAGELGVIIGVAEAAGVLSETVGGRAGAGAQAARIVIARSRGTKNRFMIGECGPAKSFYKTAHEQVMG